MLIVVHNVTAATRLADIVPLIATDRRIQVLFTVTGSSAFTTGTRRFLLEQGIQPVKWAKLKLHEFDLAISASYGGRLWELKAPLIVVPHGMGYNKYLKAGKPESRKAGKPESRKAGKPESRKAVFGLSAEWLTNDGVLIPSAVVLSHPEQLDRLRASSPEAAEIAVLAGDPSLDRMLASRPLRAAYRSALGSDGDRRIIVISSTWGASSLFGLDPELVPYLAARLPLDEYRIVLALHPNIWYWHSSWQVRMWLDDCRRAGVRVLPPEAGWQAALVAADVVIGDHGSVTFYAAALGVPVLLASAPHETVDPRSPIGLFLATAPRLHRDANPVAQLEAAIQGQGAKTLRPITALATSDPGESAPLLRSAIYRMLDLDEPATPADTRAVPVPTPTSEPVGALFVAVQFALSEGETVAEIRRFPAELPAVGRFPAEEIHLMVDAEEPFRRWLELADIAVLPAVADIGPALAAMPGCLLGTASAGRDEWLVQLVDGRQVRFTSVTVDGRVCASIVYAWLAAGNPLEVLPDHLSVRIGLIRASLDVAVLGRG